MDERIRKYMRRIGRKGGATKSPRKARTTEQARAAANVRWERERQRAREAVGYEG